MIPMKAVKTTNTETSIVNKRMMFDSFIELLALYDAMVHDQLLLHHLTFKVQPRKAYALMTVPPPPPL